MTKKLSEEDTIEMKTVTSPLVFSDGSSNVSINTYPANSSHNEEWTFFHSYPDDTPIARAWRRLYDRGIEVGPPITPPYQTDRGTVQLFQYAKGLQSHFNNTNNIVIFSDARGNVGIESGL